MAKNQALPGTPTCRRFALCPSTVASGDFVFIGSIPAVALNDYSSTTGGTTFDTAGSFVVTIEGYSTVSVATPKAIAPGDPVYLEGGVYDATTNCTTGGVLAADTSTALRNGATAQAGYLDPQYQKSVAAGATDTAAWLMLRKGD